MIAQIFFLVLLFFVSSCGYHLEDKESVSTGLTTISVPYIKKDIKGQFTNELIKQIASSGYFEYVPQGGALTLNVEIVTDSTGKIGYRYDRKDKSGKLTKHLVPTEGRREVTAEITLYDEAAMKEVIKPTLVKANTDYDFIGAHSLCDLSFISPDGFRRTVSSFSLGQLDSVEGAQDDAAVPLSRRLAEKIVNGLILQRWYEKSDDL